MESLNGLHNNSILIQFDRVTSIQDTEAVPSISIGPNSLEKSFVAAVLVILRQQYDPPSERKPRTQLNLSSRRCHFCDRPKSCRVDESIRSSQVCVIEYVKEFSARF